MRSYFGCTNENQVREVLFTDAADFPWQIKHGETEHRRYQKK